MKIANIFVNDPESDEYRICVVEKISRKWKRLHYFTCETCSDESSGNYCKHFRYNTITRIESSWERSRDVKGIIEDGFWKKCRYTPDCLNRLLEDPTLNGVEEKYEGCETRVCSW